MTSTLDMIRGRSNIVTLTNNSGGGLVAGDVCIQDTSADENVTTTTSAASVSKVFIAAETIASGAAGKFYESGYCPLVNVNASVTRGRFLFTHTVAKQAAENATYGAGAFGKILKSGTTPSAIIYSATAQVAGAGTIGGSTGSTDNAIIRADGTGGSTVQSSLATVDDSGGVNIPTGQTYNINGSPHTHAGGSGATIYESAYASPPSTPSEGDLWLITDSFLSARRGASTWSYYYGSRRVIKPPTSWTWFNQGSATYTDLGHITLYTPGATVNVRGISQAVTAGTFSCEAIVKPFKPWNSANSASNGMFLTDGTAAILYGYAVGNGDITIEYSRWTNTTTFSAAPLSAVWRYYALVDYLYLRIRETGGTRYFEISPDGVNYAVMLSEATNTFLTATGCGIGLETESASYISSVTLLHWNQS